MTRFLIFNIGAVLKDSQKCGDFIDADNKKFLVAVVDKVCILDCQ